MTEEQLQADCFQNIWNTIPETRGRVRLIHNNPKNKIQGGFLKAMGLQPGISDHCMIVSGGMIWLECKLPDGFQSKAQKEFEKMVNKLEGHYYYIYRSVEDFEEIVRKHL